MRGRRRWGVATASGERQGAEEQRGTACQHGVLHFVRILPEGDRLPSDSVCKALPSPVTQCRGKRVSVCEYDLWHENLRCCRSRWRLVGRFCAGLSVRARAPLIFGQHGGLSPSGLSTHTALHRSRCQPVLAYRPSRLAAILPLHPSDECAMGAERAGHLPASDTLRARGRLREPRRGQYGLRAYRRPLTTAEVTTYSTLFYRSELSAAGAPLSGYEIAAKASTNSKRAAYSTNPSSCGRTTSPMAPRTASKTCPSSSPATRAAT